MLCKDATFPLYSLNCGVAHPGMHGDLHQFQIYLPGTVIISDKILLIFHQSDYVTPEKWCLSFPQPWILFMCNLKHKYRMGDE